MFNKTKEQGIKALKYFFSRPKSIVSFFLFSIMAFPLRGFCEINTAFQQIKTQLELLVSDKLGLSWIIIAVLLIISIFQLIKGNWKAVGFLLIICLIIGGFSGWVDGLSSINIFAGKK